MVVKVKPDQLDTAIAAQLETYNAAITENLSKGYKETAEKVADTLKKGGPYKERTGKYTPDWAVTDRKNVGVFTANGYSVHNRKHYQLTHLLEKGHVARNGKRTRAYEHILPAEQAAQELAVEAVEKAVKSANGGI